MRTFTTLIFLSGVALFSCKKGDTGPAGTDGKDGQNGNANVVQYNFGQQNFITNSFVTLSVSTTRDTMENSQWFAYLRYAPIDRWYAIPGAGLGGGTAYRLSFAFEAGKVNLYIDKTGAGEIYDKARVVRVYINKTLSGGRSGNRNSLPDIDFGDYETVRQYYNLPK